MVSGWDTPILPDQGGTRARRVLPPVHFPRFPALSRCFPYLSGISREDAMLSSDGPWQTTAHDGRGEPLHGQFVLGLYYW